MCIYERDFAQNNAVLKRKENEHGKKIVRIQVTKISLPIQATAEDLTDQRTRIKTKVRIVQQTATKMQMMNTN